MSKKGLISLRSQRQLRMTDCHDYDHILYSRDLILLQSNVFTVEKKEEIWLSPMTKAPTPTEKLKKQRDNIKTPPKTSITQQLRTD